VLRVRPIRTFSDELRHAGTDSRGCDRPLCVSVRGQHGPLISSTVEHLRIPATAPFEGVPQPFGHRSASPIFQLDELVLFVARLPSTPRRASPVSLLPRFGPPGLELLEDTGSLAEVRLVGRLAEERRSKPRAEACDARDTVESGIFLSRIVRA
jgi:hypothetical protein